MAYAINANGRNTTRTMNADDYYAQNYDGQTYTPQQPTTQQAGQPPTTPPIPQATPQTTSLLSNPNASVGDRLSEARTIKQSDVYKNGSSAYRSSIDNLIYNLQVEMRDGIADGSVVPKKIEQSTTPMKPSTQQEQVQGEAQMNNNVTQPAVQNGQPTQVANSVGSTTAQPTSQPYGNTQYTQMAQDITNQIFLYLFSLL